MPNPNPRGLRRRYTVDPHSRLVRRVEVITDNSPVFDADDVAAMDDPYRCRVWVEDLHIASAGHARRPVRRPPAAAGPSE